MLGLVGCGKNVDTKYETNDSNSSTTVTTNNNYQVLAWNDLGMHCMDGDDYSVFSILPPYNNLFTQLIKKDGSKPELISSDITISYQSEATKNGIFNTSSANKTNFWDYASKLFNTKLKKDIGLTGSPVQSNKPASLSYKENHSLWSAEGIPTVPKDDNNKTNNYPLVRVVAKDSKGEILAETITVLPVSDEMDCKKCHSSKVNYPSAKPTKGYVNDTNDNKDYKYNILRLHDQNHDISSFLSDLKELGYEYNNSLEQTARNGTPILCASCHKSNALDTKGVAGLPSLTSALHTKHSNVIDPKNGKSLNDSSNRSACYACHPGEETKCLRGAMGNAVDSNGTQKMQCQNCHGNMNAVGHKDREGWRDLPNCQTCHQDGHRYTNALTDINIGTLREAVDNRFATNPDTPKSGISLYKDSVGHGGVQCSACHGATHAIYGSSKDEDNIQNELAQGHAGTLSKCTSCHQNMPITVNGGPHGMHSTGSIWVTNHKKAVQDNGIDDCKYCHAKDLKGSALSKLPSAKILAGKSFNAGHQISCYDCHDGKKASLSFSHSTDAAWIRKHQTTVINEGTSDCKTCHGEALRGTNKSKVFKTKRLAGKVLTEGHNVSCYDCHNGPSGIGY